MRYFLIIILSWIGVNANATLAACQSLEQRIFAQINPTKQSSCRFNLINAKNNMTNACNSLAIARTFPAQQSSAAAYNELDLAVKQNCPRVISTYRRGLLRILRDDVASFQNTL